MSHCHCPRWICNSKVLCSTVMNLYSMATSQQLCVFCACFCYCGSTGCARGYCCVARFKDVTTVVPTFARTISSSAVQSKQSCNFIAVLCLVVQPMMLCGRRRAQLQVCECDLALCGLSVTQKCCSRSRNCSSPRAPEVPRDGTMGTDLSSAEVEVSVLHVALIAIPGLHVCLAKFAL